MQVVLEFSFDKKELHSVDDALFYLQEALLETGIPTLPYFENDKLCLIIDRKFLVQTKNLLTSLSLINLETEKEIEEIDWVKNLKDNFKDLEFNTFKVLSSIKKDEGFKSDGNSIFIKAGTGFGTGHHPTTYMLLSIIEENEQIFREAKQILDLGCGSGILAIVIAKLFNKEVLGVDNDELAIENAMYNVSLNDTKLVSLSVSDKIPSEVKFDVIVANLFSELLISFSSDFFSSLNQGGNVLVSGILNDQVAEVRDKFMSIGLKEIISKNKTDENSNTWHALVFEK